MKPAIVILAALTVAFVVPWIGLCKVRKAWHRGRKSSISGYAGAVFAILLFRLPGGRPPNVVEGGHLFYEKFSARAQCIILSRAVYKGRHLSALAWAALQAGMALGHKAHSKPMARLVSWNCTMRVLVNILPLVMLYMLFHPTSWRAAPLLVLLCLFITVIQVLTFPAAQEAAKRAKDIVHAHQLLPPAEMEEFNAALKGAAERHLAAPLLDCFWLAWMLRL